MRYYKFVGESGIRYGYCTVYVEVDVSRNIVTRQVENDDTEWRFGWFDGKALKGQIADCNASELSLGRDEEIDKDSFEEVWQQATRR